MSFSDAISTGLRKYATFRGRARRSELWWFVLFGVLVHVIASVLDTAMGLQALHVDIHLWTLWFRERGVLVVLASAFLLLPTLAVGVRRLHDVGRTGLWLLVVLVPCVGLLLLLVFWCSRGQRAANRYGEPPDPGGGL
jgi:uncharacterized membrane protein YhaH (DUF805 family)